MANFFTNALGFTKQITGENPDGVWGSTLNLGNIALIETAIAGREEVDVTAGTVTLTRVNGSDDDSRAMILIINGSPGAARTVIVPTLQKLYIISNECGETVTVRTNLGSGIEILDGVRTEIFVNQILDVVEQVFQGGTPGSPIVDLSGAAIATPSVWVNGTSGDTTPTTYTNIQGKIVTVNFAPSNHSSGHNSVTINDAAMILVPASGSFPNPPKETVDWFEIVDENGTQVRCHARMSTDGSQIEWLKTDGTVWITGSVRQRTFGFYQTQMTYSLADLA